ncbi:hypothetical protein HK099_000538, partial [Clydaea vesicula]
VEKLSFNYGDDVSLVTVGDIPLNIHNVGLFVRNMFDYDVDYFDKLKNAHQFQVLTESNKTSLSHRKGIYLTNVEKDDNNICKFNLLRCSTNLDGPTETFKKVDLEIVSKVNGIANLYFENPYTLNHALAQIYENSKTFGANEKAKDNKARIKSHSDKTKDMPSNGLIAFCTFYSAELFERAVKNSRDDFHDYMYKNGSVLTKLSFKLKKTVEEQTGLKKQFTITLYPNSLFLIPLSTNRMYTHEIVPSGLPVDKIPTRLGYVIRCSKTKAIHKNGNAYICEGKDCVLLKRPTEKDVADIKALYFEENTTDNVINYGAVNFSLNNGDYQPPNSS